MPNYSTVRDPDMLGPLIGARVVDVTQQDQDEWNESGEAYIALHFDNGMVVRVPIGDSGFDVLNHPTAGGDESEQTL